MEVKERPLLSRWIWRGFLVVVCVAQFASTHRHLHGGRGLPWDSPGVEFVLALLIDAGLLWQGIALVRVKAKLPIALGTLLIAVECFLLFNLLTDLLVT